MARKKQCYNFTLSQRHLLFLNDFSCLYTISQPTCQGYAMDQWMTFLNFELVERWTLFNFYSQLLPQELLGTNCRKIQVHRHSHDTAVPNPTAVHSQIAPLGYGMIGDPFWEADRMLGYHQPWKWSIFYSIKATSTWKKQILGLKKIADHIQLLHCSAQCLTHVGT